MVCESHVVIGNVGDSHSHYFAERDETTADTFNVKELQTMCKIARTIPSVRLADPCFSDFAMTLKEIQRAEDAGLEVKERFVQSLATARSFGDFDHKSNPEIKDPEKQGVIARPSVAIAKRHRTKREAIGLYTDGVVYSFHRTVYNRWTYSEETRSDSQSGALLHAKESVLSAWDSPSLVSAANKIFNRARNEPEGSDNAGMILVRFSENNMAVEETKKE